MRRSFRILACALIGSLIMSTMLCGCKKGDKQTGNVIESDNADAKEAADVEDGELTGDSPVVSVGDITTTYGEFMTYMYVLQNKYKNSIGDEVWNYTLTEGRKVSDIAKEQVASHIVTLKVIALKAGLYGIELDTDEKDEITRYAQSVFAGISEEDRTNYMITEDVLTQIYMENEIASKVYNACIGSVDTNISDEDARMITVQYIYLKSGNLKKAEALRKKAKKAVRKNDFATLAKLNSDAPGSEMTFGHGDIDPAVENVAMALKKGQLSNVIQAEDGCYIIYCINDNEEELTANRKEEIIEKAQREIFETQYKDWVSEYNISISSNVL